LLTISVYAHYIWWGQLNNDVPSVL